jgi:hypothetical protein
MKRFQWFCQVLALPMVVVMLLTSMPLGLARAALVTTDEIVDATMAQAERDRVVAFMQRDDVRQQMEALGVDPNEAAARVAGLSDAEIRTIAGELDRLPAGQDLLGSLVGAALIIFIVLLLTDLLGLTNVFPFVRR